MEDTKKTKEIKTEPKSATPPNAREGDKLVNTKDLRDVGTLSAEAQADKEKDMKAAQAVKDNLAEDMKKTDEYHKSKKVDRRALSEKMSAQALTAEEEKVDGVEDFKPGRKYKKGDTVKYMGGEFTALVDHDGNNAPNLWAAK